MSWFVFTGVFDVLLTHNRWTLVNRATGPLLDVAAARGMGLINAAVFGGGILCGRRTHDESCPMYLR